MNFSLQLSLLAKQLLPFSSCCCSTLPLIHILEPLDLTGISDLLSQSIKPIIQLRTVTKLAFPHRNHSPSQCLQMCRRHFIPMPVPSNLRFPELNICFRFSRIATSFVPVPEATIYHYCNTIFGQDNVWATRQLPIMKTKPEPTSMQPLPNQNFRFGVLATDAGHAISALV